MAKHTQEGLYPSAPIHKFKKDLLSTVSHSGGHAKKLGSICKGYTPETMRDRVNMAVRVAIVNHPCAYTAKKNHVLRCLDVNSSIDEWLTDFKVSVAPFIVEKIDPALIK